MTSRSQRVKKRERLPAIVARASAPRASALVTGGAIRLGRAIALDLAQAGMNVAIGYHRSRSAARKTVGDLEQLGVKAVAIRADLRRPEEAQRLVVAAASALGGLDVLVNSAAVFDRTPFERTTPAQYDALLDLNLRGAFFCAQAAARAMRRRGGHIVNLGDVGADQAWPGYIPYTMSKAGIAALTRGLAKALATRGIAVNGVAPGAVLRPPRFPLKRWRVITRRYATTVADVTGAVRFFATCPRDVTGRIAKLERRRRRTS